MSLSKKILDCKIGLEETGCRPTQIRMAPDIYGALCAEMDVSSYGALTTIHGLTVKVSKNIKRGTVTIEEDAKALRKRLKAADDEICLASERFIDDLEHAEQAQKGLEDA